MLWPKARSGFGLLRGVGRLFFAPLRGILREEGRFPRVSGRRQTPYSASGSTQAHSPQIEKTGTRAGARYLYVIILTREKSQSQLVLPATSIAAIATVPAGPPATCPHHRRSSTCARRAPDDGSAGRHLILTLTSGCKIGRRFGPLLPCRCLHTRRLRCVCAQAAASGTQLLRHRRAARGRMAVCPPSAILKRVHAARRARMRGERARLTRAGALGGPAAARASALALHVGRVSLALAGRRPRLALLSPVDAAGSEPS